MTCMARDTSWQSAKIGTSGTTETSGTFFCVGECPYAGDGACPHDMTGRVPTIKVDEEELNAIRRIKSFRKK